MNKSQPFRIVWKDVLASRWCDAAIVLGLILFASVSFYTTPEFAANLPQDGADSAIPAVNLLERGKLVLAIFGHDHPPSHPFGLSLLLIPAYVVAGHFLGNGIYAILFCAFGSIALIYLLGWKLGGRWCGSFAALFLITHYGFWQYSQKIMSEVPSIFLLTSVLALVLSPGKKPGMDSRCVLVGAILGLAVTVRYDNLLWFVPIAALLSVAGPWRERLRRLGLCLAGLAPWLLLLAAYQQRTFGSPWRTGYSYWGNAGDSAKPLLSLKYITTAGFMEANQIEGRFASLIEGNGTFYAKSLLAEVDTTRIFGNPLYWQLPGRNTYQLLALLRTVLGIAGIGVCLASWRTNPLRREFVIWLGLAALTSVGLYLLYSWQEERFLMRLVPFFCLANALGLAALLAAWTAKPFRVIAVALSSALIVTLAFYNWQMGFPSGNDLHLYEIFTNVTRQMEPDAVVVTDVDPIRLDAYLIRGTRRTAVPLTRHPGGLAAFVNGKWRIVSIDPFVAAEDPERLRELLHAGRPVYWLTDNPWSGRPRTDLNALGRSFELRVLATANPNGAGEQPYFGRVNDFPQIR